jgi:hypothetical protein
MACRHITCSCTELTEKPVKFTRPSSEFYNETDAIFYFSLLSCLSLCVPIYIINRRARVCLYVYPSAPPSVCLAIPHSSVCRYPVMNGFVLNFIFVTDPCMLEIDFISVSTYSATARSPEPILYAWTAQWGGEGVLKWTNSLFQMG